MLDATVEDLKSVPGVGEHTAVLIKLMPAMGQAYVADRSGKGTLVLNRVDAAEILRPYFFGARNELIYILCMDSKGKLLGVRKVADGTIDAAEINTRRLVEEALSLRAAAIYVAHNHVSNLALPSSMDWITTDRLRDLLAGMGIILKDHLIFVDDDFVSIGASDPRYRNALFDIT
ncbi:MAG: JAB domain-containing protein [Bacteroidales bacterium]|nr:JAB domain-containing protein [Bacteroidales bacterium]